MQKATSFRKPPPKVSFQIPHPKKLILLPKAQEKIQVQVSISPQLLNLKLSMYCQKMVDYSPKDSISSKRQSRSQVTSHAGAVYVQD